MFQQLRITQYINSRDFKGMNRMLATLSNMEFRRVETNVRSSILPSLDNDLFWEALLHLIIFKRAAFITGAAAIEHLAKNDSLNFANEHVKGIYEHLKETNPESIAKIANITMPHLLNEQQVEDMFSAFHIDNEISRLSILLKTESPLSYYLIFKSLKMLDDRLVARKCCQVIMKRNNDMAFNVVSLIKTYFAIENLPARFSLNIAEYELSHIDRDYDTFLNILNGKRPKI